jgi:hypothetical protein
MPKKVGLIPERKDMGILADFYGKAGTMIRDELLKVNYEDFKELEAQRIQRKVDIIINNMNRFAVTWSKKANHDAYRDSREIARKRLVALDAKKDPLFDKKIHANSIEEGQEITAKDLIKANNTIKTNIATYLYLSKRASQKMAQVQAWDLRDEEVIAGLLDEAITEGASRGELDMLIRKHFHRALYEKKFININGRNYDLIKYAKMVSRTRLRKVQSEAVKNECLEYDNDLIQISDHGTETKICMKFEGNIYSISGKNRDYPKIPGYPPYHPNCMHSAFPTSEAAIEWEKELCRRGSCIQGTCYLDL